MQAHGPADPEALYEHFLAAGDRARAAVYATRAGDKATAALAFDRAAAFFQRALDLVAPGGAEIPRLQVQLGNALANAGRGVEAANAYVTAAGQATGTEALALRRLGAEQLLRCGHIDQGLLVMESVLAPLGLRLATPCAAPPGVAPRLGRGPWARLYRAAGGDPRPPDPHASRRVLDGGGRPGARGQHPGAGLPGATSRAGAARG